MGGGKTYLIAIAGISCGGLAADDALRKLSGKGSFVYLKEDGEDSREFEFPPNPIFILGDNRDLTEEEEQILLSYSPDKICIGPRSLHADHCMIIVQNDLDRREA